MAERLGRALQKLVQRFESARDLNEYKRLQIICSLLTLDQNLSAEVLTVLYFGITFPEKRPNNSEAMPLTDTTFRGSSSNTCKKLKKNKH